MKEKFYCEKCKKIFVASGQKVESNNYTYGKTWKWVSKCECGEDCDQYKPKKDIKKKPKSACAGNCASCPYQ